MLIVGGVERMCVLMCSKYRAYVCFSVSGNEAATPVPDTFERAHRRDRAVRPEVRQRDGRLEREQGRRESEIDGDQVQDVGEQELHGFAHHRFEPAKPPAAQIMSGPQQPVVPRVTHLRYACIFLKTIVIQNTIIKRINDNIIHALHGVLQLSGVFGWVARASSNQWHCYMVTARRMRSNRLYDP